MEQIYAILVASFFLSKYFSYDNNFRIIILIITYPLLALNCYDLSLKIHANKKLPYIKKKRLICEEIFQIILFSLVINYLQTNEILFDIDDRRRYIIIIISSILFFYKFFKYV